MGLEKTLTMIAAIASSLADAQSWSESWNSESATENSTAEIPVKTTLVIVPSPLILEGWVDELTRHVHPNCLTYYKYHGQGRCLDIKSPLPYDVVLTTYGTVSAEFARGGGALGCYKWYRIVLDEAHLVRNSLTKTFNATMNFSAVNRWCMTGTPVQNSLDDLESLIKFLRLPLSDSPSVFRKFVSGPASTGMARQPNFDSLRLLLGSICLRRSTSILSELGVSFELRTPTLTETERQEYGTLEAVYKEKIKAAANRRSGKGEGRSILTAILLLRIYCNTGAHTNLKLTNFVERSHPDEVLSLMQQSGESACIKCHADIAVPGGRNVAESKRLLGRLLCPDCMPRGSLADTSSPLDEHVLGAGDHIQSTRSQHSPGNADPDVEMTGTSTQMVYPSKIICLLDDIKAHMDEDKCIVFSYWQRSLDLVGQILSDNDIPHRRVDGRVAQSQRKKIFREFSEHSSIRVLLITQGTGAVGLNNLSVANRVHILEPQWNPSVESQAIGRVLRLGQKRKVCVIRYVVEGTIEEAVESRQYMKVNLAQKGGLHSSDDQGSLERQKRVNKVQELAKSLNLI